MVDFTYGRSRASVMGKSRGLWASANYDGVLWYTGTLLHYCTLPVLKQQNNSSWSLNVMAHILLRFATAFIRAAVRNHLFDRRVGWYTSICCCITEASSAISG